MEIAVLGCLGIGLLFMLVATVGFVRLPDVYCRLHVTSILDTLGAPVILLGAAVYLGPGLASGKLLLAIAFLYLTSPLVGHLLSRAAWEGGYPAYGLEEHDAAPQVSPRKGRSAQSRTSRIKERQHERVSR